MATPSLAQSAGQRSSPGLSEILVTAEKRVESLQDTLISISALDAEALETRRVVSLGDLAVAVPNMQVSTHPNAATTLRVTIRGIGEVSAVQTRDAPVAIYVDGVYVAKSQGLANEAADLERVEVLRGPQGTLYGRNATAGAINFITKAPELGEWKAKQSLTFGSRNEFRSRTSVNTPIGDDLAAKITYLRVKKNGFVKNLGPGSKRFGDVDRHAVRPFLPFDNNNRTNQKQFSQELQLVGDTFDGGLKYIAGLYYFSGKDTSDDFSDQPVGYQPRTAHWNNKAYAVFGQATWTPQILNERLHITFGARWSKDKRWADVYSTIYPPTGGVDVLLNAEGSKSFSDFSPTGTIQFDVTDDVNVYAKVSKGYETGGFNPTASSPLRFANGFGPETLVSYEAGLKSELFDRRVRFNLAGYYSKYKDIQVSVFDPFNNRIFDVINAGRAVAQGFEANLTAVVFDGMTVSGSYGYVDPKFNQVLDLGGNDITQLFHFAHAQRTASPCRQITSLKKQVLGLSRPTSPIPSLIRCTSRLEAFRWRWSENPEALAWTSAWSSDRHLEGRARGLENIRPGECFGGGNHAA